MKKQISYIMAALAVPASMLLGGCASDEPFGEGEGVLKMKMVVNSTLTRAETDQQDLADKCVVYLSGSKGLLYKFQGLDNVPSDIFLKSGSYVAEAWTGDSVSASFDKKFYRAYEPFTISRGDVKNVVLNCKIANVVASINPEPIIAEALKDYKVTVENTRGSLDFDVSNAKTAHGYYMMPNGDTSLKWTITGKKEDGSAFSKSGTIDNVQRAHEYVLNIRYTPGSTEVGGGFIIVTVDDTELLIEDTVELTGAPAIEGIGYDINQPFTGEAGSFSRTSVYVESLGALSSLLVKTDAATAMALPSSEFDFITMTAESRQALANAGVTCEYTEGAKSSAKIMFAAEALNRLSNGEYSFEVTAVDVAGKRRTRTLKFIVSDATVMPQPIDEAEVHSYSVTLRGTIMKDDAVNPSFRYREAGASDWVVVPAVADKPYRKSMRKVAGQGYHAVVTGLKPSTRYEYQAIADGYVNPNTQTFTTESVFVLPNAGFEIWSTNAKGAYIPGADGTVSFWDTGNHGSMTLKKNITFPVEAPVHSGSYAAKLSSQFVGLGSIGKFAAGNLFAGTYDKTVGTSGGELTFGRPFDGSRPVKLRGYVYYHPGTVDYSETDKLAKGNTDIGSVYVALTSSKVAVKTASKELFEPDASYVLAYGAIDFTSDYGSESGLREFEITLDYRTASKLPKDSYLVLVASASKYGDYFTGSSQSVMVIDDLELIYK